MPPRIGLFLPGQGFQKPGMLRPFQNAFPAVVNPIVEQVDRALPKLRLRDALLDPDHQESITPTFLAQPLILATSFAIYKTLLLQDLSIDIRYVMGHSLGEFTAWAVAGILPFEQAVKLVHERGIAMHDATKGKETAMVVVVSPRKSAENFDSAVDAIVKKYDLDFGNFNSLTQRALSGDRTTLERAVADLKSSYPRLVVSWLDVSGAFHSRHMTPAKATLKKLADDQAWEFPGKYQVISNLTAAPFDSLSQIKQSCVETLVNPVLWQKSAQLVASKVDAIVSIGPGKVGKLTQNEYKTPTVFYDEPKKLVL